MVTPLPVRLVPSAAPPTSSAFSIQEQPQKIDDASDCSNQSALGDSDALVVSLREHHICMYIPLGSKVDCITMDLPGGILIQGALRGRVTCAQGSVIIEKTGEFQGSIVADNVIIAGKITSLSDSVGMPAAATMSHIEARSTISSSGQVEGGVVAFSDTAYACARFKAAGYHTPRGANLSRSVLEVSE